MSRRVALACCIAVMAFQVAGLIACMFIGSAMNVATCTVALIASGLSTLTINDSMKMNEASRGGGNR